MTPITKKTYVDNWESDIKKTVEIGINGKKAFIRHDNLEIINRDNIKNLPKYQAFRIAMSIAKLAQGK